MLDDLRDILSGDRYRTNVIRGHVYLKYSHLLKDLSKSEYNYAWAMQFIVGSSCTLADFANSDARELKRTGAVDLGRVCTELWRCKQHQTIRASQVVAVHYLSLFGSNVTMDIVRDAWSITTLEGTDGYFTAQLELSEEQVRLVHQLRHERLADVEGTGMRIYGTLLRELQRSLGMMPPPEPPDLGSLIVFSTLMSQRCAAFANGVVQMARARRDLDERIRSEILSRGLVSG